MKLWLLRPKENLPEGDNPWEPWYDACHGFIARAGSPSSARKLADAEGGAENRDTFLDRVKSKTQHPWLDPKYTTCTELTADGESKVIISDFWAA